MTKFNKNTPIGGLQMFDPTTDRNGAALKTRAYDQANDYYGNLVHETGNNGDLLGQAVAMQQRYPAMQSSYDPQGFGAFFQAFNEATGGKGKIAPPSGRGDPMAGLQNARTSIPSTLWDPNRQSSAVTGEDYASPSINAMNGVKPFQETGAFNALRKLR